MKRKCNMKENGKIFTCSSEMKRYKMTAKRIGKPKASLLVNQNNTKGYARIIETNTVTFQNEQKSQY